MFLRSGKVDDALDLIRGFASKHPPSSAHAPSTPSSTPSLATYTSHDRTHLTNPIPVPFSPLSPLSPLSDDSQRAVPRPLVQLVSPTLVSDPLVPPFLGFADVEILHQRLLVLQRFKDIGYLKWLVKAYGGALRKRRDGQLEHLKPRRGKTASGSTRGERGAEEG